MSLLLSHTLPCCVRRSAAVTLLLSNWQWRSVKVLAYCYCVVQVEHPTKKAACQLLQDVAASISIVKEDAIKDLPLNTLGSNLPFST